MMRLMDCPSSFCRLWWDSPLRWFLVAVMLYCPLVVDPEPTEVEAVLPGALVVGAVVGSDVVDPEPTE